MYEMLKEAFIRKEWGNDEAVSKGKYSVWLKQGEKRRLVFERFEVNAEYFYDRYCRAKQGKSISLDERLAVAVLGYIGITGRTFTEMNPNFRNSLKRPSRKKNANTGAIAQAESLPQKSEWDQATATVLRFYDAINNGPTHYEEAWSCLTPRLQHSICESDFDRFCEGYNNTVAIKNIKVFNVASSAEGAVECSVYYIDEFRNYRSPTLSGWDEFTVAHLDEFVSKVKRLKAEVEAAGGRGFDRIELYKLFEPAASEYVWYKCRIKRDDIPLVFPTFKHTELKRLYRVTCKRIHDDWLIDTIRLLPVHSSR
ncbi:hypothetical protein [Spirosoma sordidisoli]|uniref:Uncharacterized protein n=1 Tax=Spirosoma sordidisoli TaxID=2502893 RepID=A0A4Q2UDG7_9BACT|nr:hypothetical protein [Spirosoma sordidisoli]RYC66974.1 hypothetical protein EQG79_26740 [Spirosoma sordidisoli]